MKYRLYISIPQQKQQKLTNSHLSQSLTGMTLSIEIIGPEPKSNSTCNLYNAFLY